MIWDYKSTRAYCLQCANMHPETQGTIEQIVFAVERQMFPERAMAAIATALAKFADERSSQQHSEGRSDG